MGGIEGTRKFPGLASYSASKAAINNLTESLAVEFQNDKIRVNAISPGTVQTKMLNDAFPGIQARTTPEEMGNFIADFAVQSGKLMNGRLIQVSFEG
jgi:NAD(P)-dependent dehydrogenase (short-subunit alcohol dehydrogenase family)